MWKRPLCEMAAGFLLGILSVSMQNRMILLAAITVGGVMAVLSCRKGNCLQGAVRAGLFFLLFILGCRRYQMELQFRETCQSKLKEGMKLTVQGELDQKEEKNHQYLYYLKNCYAVFSEEIIPCNQVILYSDEDSYSIGEVLIAEGKLEQWRTAANEGNFDEKSYYESRKIDFKLKGAEVLAVYGQPDILKEALYCARQKIRQVYALCFDEADSGIMAAMALGDKSLLEEEVKELYQKAGISHILAISGLHISVIGMSLYQILRKMRLSYLKAGVFAGLFMTGFGVMSGFGISTVRAVFMFLIMLMGQGIGRSYDLLSALGAAAIFILWDNPFFICYAGFLFSFAAVLGIAAVGRIVREAGIRYEEEETEKSSETFFHKKFCQFKETFLMSFSMQLMTLPLTAFFYFEIPVYAIWINLIILPLMSILLFLGLAGGALGIWFLPGAKLLFVPCRFILSFYQKVCVYSEKLPGASIITGKPEMIKMVLFYLMLGGLLLWISYKKSRRGFTAAGLLLLCMLFYRSRGGFELDVLDVGQGDGSYLQTESGVHLFIDGGSTNINAVGKYRILPFLKSKGVSGIDYWIVSHTDSDHISGLMEVLETGFQVRYLIFSKEIVRDEAFEKLADMAEKHQTELLFLRQGEKLHFGEGVLTCLYPGEADVSLDKNAMSLVAEYREGDFSGVFTGDIGTAEEKKLAESAMTSKVFFYKAAHHGSNGSNSEELLAVMEPEIIAVSCGANNVYGHPGKEAVARMEKSGGKIFFTMEYGQIKIKRGKDGELIVLTGSLP